MWPCNLGRPHQEKPDWDQAKRLLNDTSIVKRLMEYDKENISDSLVRRLRRITDDPEFQPELVRMCSAAPAGAM